MDDSIFDVFLATFIPLTSNLTRQELSMRTAGCDLLARIGPSFLVSHFYRRALFCSSERSVPEYVVGNVNVEPATIPFESYSGNASSSVSRTANRPRV